MRCAAYSVPRLACLLLNCALALSSSSGCVASPAATSSLEADGVYVRHVRIRVVPSHTKAFEALVTRCLAAAQAAELPSEYSWLCYREPPGRYWLLWFSETENGFALPDRPDPLAGFARKVAGTVGGGAPAEIEEQLGHLDYEIEWNALHRQRASWSTVSEMSIAAHPKARMMVRTVQPGSEADFERALAARTAFLAENGYPLPIEGFVTLSGAPGTAMQVVFAVDWPSFHATTSFGAFVRALDPAAQEAYAELKQALMVTMQRAEYHDGSVVDRKSVV
jgi:hypothetical protein